MKQRGSLAIHGVMLMAVFGIISNSPAAGPEPDVPNRFLTVHAKVDFEVEEVNIPGWRGGAFSETAGSGEITLSFVFKPEGGVPWVHAGEARMTTYGCRGSAGCSCTAPSELFSKTWKPVILRNCRWDPTTDTLILRGPVVHAKDTMSLRIVCPGVSTSVEDHPIFKLIGAFGPGNERRKDTGFPVSLEGTGPWTKTFPHELYADGPKVFRAKITITVREGTPESE